MLTEGLLTLGHHPGTRQAGREPVGGGAGVGWGEKSSLKSEQPVMCKHPSWRPCVWCDSEYSQFTSDSMEQILLKISGRAPDRQKRREHQKKGWNTAKGLEEKQR